MSYVFCFLLASCTGKKDKTPTYEGRIDFDAIASDTIMQNNIEVSYEYVKDHNFGNTQYSIASGGFTGFENVLVIKREDVTDYDTIAVVKQDSPYRLTESFLSDNDQNNLPEIHLVFTKIGDTLKQEKQVIFLGGKWRTK